MPLTIQTYRGHTIGSQTGFGKAEMEGLVQLFERPSGKRSSALEGRTPITCGQVDKIGPVAVKVYTRGGLINHVTRHHYMRIGKTRCQKEFEMLAAASQFGISIPDPIAFAYHGRMVYRGWLVTREVNRPLNLAQLCMVDENRCREALTELADQIRRMIENHMIHVDLHPGNVLVDDSYRVFIVDFDRARIDDWNEAKLRRHYISRWNRAIVKHGLPSLLSEGLLAHM